MFSRRLVLGALFLVGGASLGRAVAPTFTNLYNFDFANYAGGSFPNGSLIIDDAGVVYGTTTEGGAFNQSACGGDGGCGTVFSLTPPASPGGSWTEAVLWSFGGSGDGAGPVPGLSIDSNGVLYGSTNQGGDHGAGTVFSLSPPTAPEGSWVEMLLHSTKPTDGFPTAMVLGNAGVLYGATQGSGSHAGTIFSLTPPSSKGNTWRQKVLFTFPDSHQNGPDGKVPNGPLLFLRSTGVLYGTTGFGGHKKNGTVFELRPPASAGAAWTIRLLHTFDGVDGSSARGGLVSASQRMLYGTTGGGGSHSGGTIFSVHP